MPAVDMSADHPDVRFFRPEEVLAAPADFASNISGCRADGGHLQGDPGQPGIVLLVVIGQPAAPVGVAVPAGDLGEEDRRLGRLALAEQ